jgi:hypothetical protein
MGVSGRQQNKPSKYKASSPPIKNPDGSLASSDAKKA